MKILFIRNNLGHIRPSMSYGMGLIATITSLAGFRVKAVDNNSFYKFYSELELFKLIKEFSPDLLCFNIVLNNAKNTYDFIKNLKNILPELIIVGGGIHMKLHYVEALDAGIDIVVNREGERIVVPLFNFLKGKNKHNFKDGLAIIQGISYYDQQNVLHISDEFPIIDDLNTLPFVDYGLFNLDDYIKNKKEPGMLIINGQRGCPYKCSFCSTQEQRDDRRIASAEYIYRNIENNYRKYGLKYISIADNNFFMPRNRVIEFCNLMIKSGLNKIVSLIAHTKVETLKPDEEYFELLNKAGFIKIMFGIERLDSFSLDKINKKSSLHNATELFSMLIKHGIDIRINMLYGFPFDTPDILEKEREALFDLLEKNPDIIPEASILQPIPGTQYYDMHPKTHNWYLHAKTKNLLTPFFKQVFLLEAIETIQTNYFDLPKKTLSELDALYWIVNKYDHQKLLPYKNKLEAVLIIIDHLFGYMSKLLYIVSPFFEYIVFKRITAIRYYLATYFFGDKLLKKQMQHSE